MKDKSILIDDRKSNIEDKYQHKMFYPDGTTVELQPKVKLGDLTVGETGQKDFGPFRLVWKVQMDHIEWSLNEKEDPQESWLSGALKYKGWNRIEVDSEISLEQQLADKKLFENNKYLSSAKPSFMVYVHEWPHLKEAIDFLYYDLGRKSAEGTYENSFVKPEILKKEDVDFVVKLAADKVRKMRESQTSPQ